MTRVILVLSGLLALSCSTPQERPVTYEKGAYRPAPSRAPAFSPTEDAPHTYGPERRPDVQPQPKYPGVPHTPKTRSEPTIWATQRPDEPIIELFAVPVPIPDTVLAASLVGRMKECAADLERAAWRSKDATAIHAMGDKQKLCLGTWLLAVCVKDNQDTRGRWDEAKATKAARATLKEIVDKLFVLRDQRCAPPSREGSVREVFNWTLAHWRESRGWGSRNGT